MNGILPAPTVLPTSSYYWLRLLAFGLFLLAACSSEAPQATPDAPQQSEVGKRLYNTHCLSCHGGATGGSMMAIPPPHNANGHTWHHPDCQLIDTILNGPGEMSQMMREMMRVPEGTPRMPAFKDTLTQEEVRAILAYIKTWWSDEQRQHQERITQQTC